MSVYDSMVRQNYNKSDAGQKLKQLRTYIATHNYNENNLKSTINQSLPIIKKLHLLV